MLRIQRGVTLMELLVVVVVVGILAAIAYPSYREQVRRSNRTEAKVALEQVGAALEKCYTRYMAYATADCPAATQFEDGDGFDTENGNYRITADIPRDEDLPSPSYLLIASRQNGQTSDSQCGDFTLDETGARGVRNASAAAATCW